MMYGCMVDYRVEYGLYRGWILEEEYMTQD